MNSSEEAPKNKDSDGMSRQVRRQLERNGDLRSEHDMAQDKKILSTHQAMQDARIAREQSMRDLGKRNIYTCDTCFKHVVTVDVAEGVTPFMIGCKATCDCEGMMQSSMYRVFDQRMRPDFEWFAPTKEETVAMSAGVREHVKKGGLVMRPRAASS